MISYLKELLEMNSKPDRRPLESELRGFGGVGAVHIAERSSTH